MASHQGAADHLSLRRLTEQVIVPTLVLLAIVGAAALWRDRLPDPMAVHWSASGIADASGGVWINTGLLAVVWVALWGGASIALRNERLPGRVARTLVTVQYGAGGALGTVWVLAVRANLDASIWETAADLGWFALLLVVGVGVVMAALGWLVARDRARHGTPVATGEVVDHTEDGDAEEVGDPADGDERPRSWIGDAVNPAGGAIAIMLLLPIPVLWPVLLPVTLRLVVSGAVGAAAVAVVWLTWSHCSIDGRRIRAGLGPLPWPGIDVYLSELAAVTVVNTSPARWRGWGLRTDAGTRRLVVRPGAALRLERRSGDHLVVSVDRAEEAADLLRHRLEEPSAPAADD